AAGGQESAVAQSPTAAEEDASVMQQRKLVDSLRSEVRPPVPPLSHSLHAQLSRRLPESPRLVKKCARADAIVPRHERFHLHKRSNRTEELECHAPSPPCMV
ncbi:MAG: hypothetical protein ACPIOQ_19705, partial [Promethearchaeia archaeon]